jgi:hypothetical protein
MATARLLKINLTHINLTILIPCLSAWSEDKKLYFLRHKLSH